jgi:hypothetical protein
MEDSSFSASQEQSNIDVSYFGVKGYRRGMSVDQPAEVAATTASEEAKESTVTSAVHPAAGVDFDSAFDVFDLNAPFSSSSTRSCFEFE